MSFELTTQLGTASALHARPFEPPVARRAIVLELIRPALVLGSTQPESDADADAARRAGVEVCRRRSGGGAVLLVPGETTWIDVELGRSDPLWDDDVGRSFHWLGRAWAAALGELGFRPEVHTGGLVESAWSRLVCFAGLGAGEVTVAGAKAVGISQRRTRAGARFQCVVHRRWDPVPLLDLLALDEGARADGRAALAGVGAGIDVEPAELVAAFVRQLE